LKYVVKMKRTGPTNIYLRLLVSDLKKAYRQYGASIWRTVAELLYKPRRKRIVVNLDRISRVTNKGDVVVVPGKVLGGGNLEHPVTIAAWRFSAVARKKIIKAGGECISIRELIRRNPRGTNVKIIG